MTTQEFLDQLKRVGPEQLIQTPILIKQALSSDDCEWITSSLIECLGDTRIEIQRKRNGQTFLHTCSLEESLDLIMDHSSPNDSILAFVEGLLEQHSRKHPRIQQAHQHVTHLRESLFHTDSDTDSNSNTDISSSSSAAAAAASFQTNINWFDSFPDEAKISDCVIISGFGAMSTLHRDPMEWTGTNLCLEGTKLWRFVPPPPPDNLLESYRLDSIAWVTTTKDRTNNNDNDGKDNKDDDDDDHHHHHHHRYELPLTIPLSAGWQSDYALFTTPKKPPAAATRSQWIHPRDLAEMSHDSVQQYMSELATNWTLLPPRLPTTISSSSSSSSLSASRTESQYNNIVSLVQEAGDLLVIPSDWYHQTYAPQPSIAIASQRCGSWEVPKVLAHILSVVHHHQQQQQSHEGESRDISRTYPSNYSTTIPSESATSPLLPKELLQESYMNCHPDTILSILFDYIRSVSSTSSSSSSSTTSSSSSSSSSSSTTSTSSSSSSSSVPYPENRSK